MVIPDGGDKGWEAMRTSVGLGLGAVLGGDLPLSWDLPER